MTERTYQECARCVMDTSDPEIEFDNDGVCNHCLGFDRVTSKRWFPNEDGRARLATIVQDIKRTGKGREYDCILGLSGGVDSSYLALMIKDYGLRPLVVHVDAGWNNELAVYNIEQVIKHCGYDLHTHVMDWEEMRDLQLAYLKSGVANQDVPQDHAFFSSMYHFAVKHRIRYVISGGNTATECVFPSSWHHSAMDAVSLLDIHRRYGAMKLKHYRTISPLQYYLWYPFIYRMQTVRPLNYMPYDKGDALRYLKKEIGYKEYGRKHGESLFTKFFQNHYLPKKYGFDKRRPHLSSMILTGQMKRSDAVLLLKEPLYDPCDLERDTCYVARKLGVSVEELNHMIEGPNRDASSFKNWNCLHKTIKSMQNVYKLLSGKDIRNYA